MRKKWPKPWLRGGLASQGTPRGPRRDPRRPFRSAAPAFYDFPSSRGGRLNTRRDAAINGPLRRQEVASFQVQGGLRRHGEWGESPEPISFFFGERLELSNIPPARRRCLGNDAAITTPAPCSQEITLPRPFQRHDSGTLTRATSKPPGAKSLTGFADRGYTTGQRARLTNGEAQSGRRLDFRRRMTKEANSK